MEQPLLDGFWLGRVGREPVNVRDPELAGMGRVWMHVNCIMEGPQAPVCVSLTRAGAMSGDRVNPGSSWETQATAAGIWLCGPKDLEKGALVAVERRLSPTNQHGTLLGELVTMTSWKSTRLGVPLTPGEWSIPWSNIIGQGFGVVHARGGTAWIGSHVDTKLPPPPTPEAMASTGGLFPLRESDGPLLIPGNPTLHATAYEPGVVLHLLKIEGGRQFGTGIWPLKEVLS